MNVDPMYGPDSEPPTDEDRSRGLGLSDAVIQAELNRIIETERKQKRAPKDRMLRHPRRDR